MCVCGSKRRGVSGRIINELSDVGDAAPLGVWASRGDWLRAIFDH